KLISQKPRHTNRMMDGDGFRSPVVTDLPLSGLRNHRVTPHRCTTTKTSKYVSYWKARSLSILRMTRLHSNVSIRFGSKDGNLTESKILATSVQSQSTCLLRDAISTSGPTATNNSRSERYHDRPLSVGSIIWRDPTLLRRIRRRERRTRLPALSFLDRRAGRQYGRSRHRPRLHPSLHGRFQR